MLRDSAPGDTVEPELVPGRERQFFNTSPRCCEDLQDEVLRVSSGNSPQNVGVDRLEVRRVEAFEYGTKLIKAAAGGRAVPCVCLRHVLYMAGTSPIVSGF